MASDTTEAEAGTEMVAFAQSTVLTTLYGDEASFEAQAADEAMAILSPDGIVDFLKARLEELARRGGNRALNWASAQLLRAIGLGGRPSELERIRTLLETITQQQEQILKQLEVLLSEVKFQHLITRGYPSMQQISLLHEWLERLSKVDDQDERNREAPKLRVEILKVSGGTMASLKTISDVLLGKNPMEGGDPLIRLFCARWAPVFLARQLQPDVPLSTYWRRLEEWLHGLFMVQYMGLSQLASARIANGDFQMLEQEIAATVKAMTEQKAMLNEAIPQWTRTLPASVVDGRRYFIRGPHAHRGGWDTTHVMYTNPPFGTHLDNKVGYRDLNRVRNGLEAWSFDRSGPNDAFILGLGASMFITYSSAGVRTGPQGRPLRIVMIPNKRAPGWGSEPFLPVLGFVGTSLYLYWLRRGDNWVVTGTIDQVSLVDIVPA